MTLRAKSRPKLGDSRYVVTWIDRDAMLASESGFGPSTRNGLMERGNRSIDSTAVVEHTHVPDEESENGKT